MPVRSYAFVVSLFSALVSAPARADLATNLSYVFDTYLFYVDGARVVRAKCDAGTVLFDRANCATEPHRVPTAKIIASIEADVGEKLPTLDRRLREQLVRITQIDQRLLVLLSVDPTPAEPQLKEEIAAKEEDRVALDAKTQAFRDQVARIEAELAHGEDPDLLDQLAVARAGQREGERALADLAEQIAELRRRFIAANSSVIDAATYDDLIRRRDGLVEEMERTRRDLDRVLTLLVETARVERQILDQTFTTERLYDNSTSEQQVPVYALAEQFEKLDLDIRTVPATLRSDGRALLLKFSAPAGIERFTCRANPLPSVSCGPMLLQSSDGFRAEVNSWSFEVRAVDGYAYPSTVKAVLQGRADAQWKVTGSDCDAAASARIFADGFYCFMIAKP